MVSIDSFPMAQVKAVPGLHLEALQEDHLSTEAARQQRCHP